MHFNQPPYSGLEFQYVDHLLKSHDLIEYGQYVHLCEKWLKQTLGCAHCLMTSSCTHALEMAALLLNIKQGDEIILPSYTFVSTANAFVLRGGIPVFVDIRADTLNLNESLIEKAITPKTRAILPVHYGGVACDMDAIVACAEKYQLAIIEDAAQGILASYKGRPLGTIGELGTLSFDIMKNLSAAGQGGALVINNPAYASRAETILHKGTNKMAFQRGEVDHYEWTDVGSCYAMGALNGAYLYANMEAANAIHERRMRMWEAYQHAFKQLADADVVRLQVIPEAGRHNGHIFSLRLKNKSQRDSFIQYMRREHIPVIFHYMPLHQSPAGKRFGRVGSTMETTINTADTLVRLPLYHGLSEDDQHTVITTALRFF